VEQNLCVNDPISAGFFWYLVSDLKIKRDLLLLRLHTVRLQKLTNQSEHWVFQRSHRNLKLIFLQLCAWKLRAEHQLHELGWAVQCFDECLLRLTLFSFLRSQTFRLHYHGLHLKNVWHVDDDIEGIHDFVAQTGGEFVWVISLHDDALSVNDILDVSDQQELSLLPIYGNCVDVNGNHLWWHVLVVWY